MAARGAFFPAQAALVAVASLLLAAQVVRTAAVADRERRPAIAAALWPAHPAVLTDKALLAVAMSAAHGKGVTPATRQDIRRIAGEAPLSADPFLIEAAIAETEGRSAAAESLLVAARDRDPRSRGTRYLLADLYARSGRVAAALSEIQVLVGLNDRGGEPFLPMLVAFAKAPGAVPQLKPFLRRNPGLESTVLAQLAGDVRNADLVLALASDRHPEPDWRGPLLSALVGAGEYDKAYATWTRLSGVKSNSHKLFNPTFAKTGAPPPFGWAMDETSEGVAEANGKGGLDVLYYGRADAVLASQLLVLPPGRYRLAMTVASPGGGQPNLHWVLRCAEPKVQLGNVQLRGGRVAGDFAVPSACKAQWLELRGIAGDTPQTSAVTIGNLRLMPETAG